MVINKATLVREKGFEEVESDFGLRVKLDARGRRGREAKGRSARCLENERVESSRRGMGHTGFESR